MARTTLDRRHPGLDPVASAVLGDGGDDMTLVERRAREAYPGGPVIVWEGDAATFEFTFVGAAAVDLLGYPTERWTREPTFWTDHVVSADDRAEAVAFCALATARRCDHVFEYRARAADGRVLVLRDLVRVVLARGARRHPVVWFVSAASGRRR